MLINLSPIRMDETLILEKKGDVLIINGEEFDFSPLLEGATLPASSVSSAWVSGDLERAGGEISLNLTLPHGPNAPEETRFPVPIKVIVDGPISLPTYNIEIPEDE